MTRYTLHLPLVLNDGTPMDDAIHDYARDQLHQLSTGWTEIVATGHWTLDNGDAVDEPVRLFIIDLPETEDYVGKLSSIGHMLKLLADQEAVYLTAEPIRTYYIR